MNRAGDASDAGARDADIARHLEYLKVERRLAERTLAMYGDAFARLRPLSDYDHLYAAARCRSEADWVVGLNATRYYTVRFRSGGLLFVRAANEGRTVIEMFPRERITEDFDALADRLIGAPKQAAAARQSFRLFGRQKEIVRA